MGTDGTSDYAYDDTGQLTSVDHDYQTDENYSYDENGNRTNTGYTTGDNNRLTSDGTFNYTYDDEGNRETRTRISSAQADDYTTEYTWDHNNRLTEIVYKNNSGTITKQVDYTYDVFGRRIFKEVDADGAGAGSSLTTEYVYDGQDILLALDDSGDVTNRYLHGPAVDQILADEQVGDEVLWPLADNLGSVRDLIDSDGNVENHLVYDAYGNVISETASAVDHIFGFTGRERDEESDLQYNRARYYDGQVGRWISEDPMGFMAGDGNLSRYVHNAPTYLVDPSGLVESEMGEPLSPTADQPGDDEEQDEFLNSIDRWLDKYKQGDLGLPPEWRYKEGAYEAWITSGIFDDPKYKDPKPSEPLSQLEDLGKEFAKKYGKDLAHKFGKFLYYESGLVEPFEGWGVIDWGEEMWEKHEKLLKTFGTGIGIGAGIALPGLVDKHVNPTLQRYDIEIEEIPIPFLPVFTPLEWIIQPKVIIGVGDGSESWLFLELKR